MKVRPRRKKRPREHWPEPSCSEHAESDPDVLTHPTSMASGGGDLAWASVPE
jgi:hypothetical protein